MPEQELTKQEVRVFKALGAIGSVHEELLRKDTMVKLTPKEEILLQSCGQALQCLRTVAGIFNMHEPEQAE